MVAEPIDGPAAAALLQRRLGDEPFTAVIVLGSGLGPLVEVLEQPATLAFEDITGLPAASVVGHGGRWVAGRLEGRRVLAQAGRYHLYEGLGPEVVCAPLRLAGLLGVETAILTNAAGGVRPDLGPGAIVLLEDHLNLTGREVAQAAAGSPYDAGLRALARRCAGTAGVDVAEGVYAGVTGPSFETPAEIRMLAALGADVVGMSTVLEACAARSAGLRCLGISLVSNHAAGLATGPLTHEEVMATGRASAARLERLVRAVVRELPQPSAGAK